MKLANNINVRVFCKDEEDKPLIIEKLKLLLPFDLENEKIAISPHRATDRILEKPGKKAVNTNVGAGIISWDPTR